MIHIESWTQESTPDESIKIIKELALYHAHKSGKQGERIVSFITGGDFLSVCDFSFDYSDGSPRELFHLRQAAAYFSKYKHLPGEWDPRGEAVRQFWKTESECRLTNEIVQAVDAGRFCFLPAVESIIFRARRKIAAILGPVPSPSELRYRFGPGATTLTTKKNASVVEKLQAGLSCSEDLFRLNVVSTHLEQMPGLLDSVTQWESESKPFEKSSRLRKLEERWAHIDEYDLDPEGKLSEQAMDELYMQIRDGLQGELAKEQARHDLHVTGRATIIVTDDVVDFVPKKAKIHRTITKTGSLNTLVQLAYGDFMFERLRAFGIDLKDQSKNQKLAIEGSLSGLIATLDLSSASDTISTEIVFLLLPIDWALALDACRSSHAWLDGVHVKLEKFSSMGNGNTFPLESLIFWALSSSASDDDFCSIIGDDIIVSTHAVPAVKQVLTTLGFTLNMEKSFWSGPFRESCGADAVSGIDIRPYYVKDLLSPERLFTLHNFYVRKAKQFAKSQDDGAKVDCLVAASRVVDLINPALRLYGPDGYGDGHLLGDWIRSSHKKSESHGYRGVLFESFKHVERRDYRRNRPGDRLLPTYTIYARESKDDVQREHANFLFWRNACRKMCVNMNLLKKLALTFVRIVDNDSGPILDRKSPVDGTLYKVPTYPGTDGYKRVSIYTFVE